MGEGEDEEEEEEDGKKEDVKGEEKQKWETRQKVLMIKG